MEDRLPDRENTEKAATRGGSNHPKESAPSTPRRAPHPHTHTCMANIHSGQLAPMMPILSLGLSRSPSRAEAMAAVI